VIPDGRVFICTSNKDYAGTPGATDDRINRNQESGVGRQSVFRQPKNVGLSRANQIEFFTSIQR